MQQKKKPLVILTRKLPQAIEERMCALFETKLADDCPMPRHRLIEAVKHADVLVPTINDIIDAEILAHAGEKLKLIANFGNGVDNIDIGAARAQGILVTNTPNVLTEDTADMTMALILAVPRRLVEGANILTHMGDDKNKTHNDTINKDAQWLGWSPHWMLGRRIYGKKLGIIGMGRIGIAVARRAKAFGLAIHYHNRNRVSPKIEEELQADYFDNLDSMLAAMDIISINCPATTATYHLLSKQRLSLMQKDAYIVNTARGEIIDESALISAINKGELAGAGLDVFAKEPDMDKDLLDLAKRGKVVLLPHMASATVEGRIAMGEKVIINIRAFFDHHRPPDRIIPQ